MGIGESDWTYLSEVQTGTISTVVIVPIHVQDFLSIDRKESREDTFGKTGSLSMSSVASGSGGVSLQEPTPVLSAHEPWDLHSSDLHRILHPLLLVLCCC
jgi:hypothetical protein